MNGCQGGYTIDGIKYQAGFYDVSLYPNVDKQNFIGAPYILVFIKKAKTGSSEHGDGSNL